MLTNNAIVKVRNKPVANVDAYLRVCNIAEHDVKKIWKKEAAETQKMMGEDFVVSLKEYGEEGCYHGKYDTSYMLCKKYKILVLPVLKKQRTLIYTPIVKGKKKVTYYDNQLLSNNKKFIKMEAA